MLISKLEMGAELTIPRESVQGCGWRRLQLAFIEDLSSYAPLLESALLLSSKAFLSH